MLASKLGSSIPRCAIDPLLASAGESATYTIFTDLSSELFAANWKLAGTRSADCVNAGVAVSIGSKLLNTSDKLSTSESLTA